MRDDTDLITKTAYLVPRRQPSLALRVSIDKSCYLEHKKGC